MNEKRYLLIALGIALLIRGVIFFQIYPDTGIISTSDQSEYLSLANYFSSNWDFQVGFGSVRVPFYPVFISLCRLVSENLFFVLIIQNIIGLFSVIISFHIGLLFSKRIGVLTAFFTAINLNFALESNLILTESIFYPTFCLMLFFLFRYSTEKRINDIIYSALLLGLCTLIRPVTMYLPIFIVPYLVLQSKISLISRLRNTAIYIILFLVVLSPWLCRNYIIFDHARLTSQGRVHIISFIMPYVMQYEEKINIAEARRKCNNLWEQKQKTLPVHIVENPFSFDHEGKKFGLNYVKNASFSSISKAWLWGAVKNIFSPATVELAFILKMDRTLFHESPGDSVPIQLFNFIFKNKNKVYSAMMIFGILGILFFRFIQTWGALRLLKINSGVFVLCFLIAAYFLIISGPVGYAKYRIPIEPILALLTAFCFEKADYAKITDDVVV